MQWHWSLNKKINIVHVWPQIPYIMKSDLPTCIQFPSNKLWHSVSISGYSVCCILALCESCNRISRSLGISGCAISPLRQHVIFYLSFLWIWMISHFPTIYSIVRSSPTSLTYLFSFIGFLCYFHNIFVHNVMPSSKLVRIPLTSSPK